MVNFATEVTFDVDLSLSFDAAAKAMAEADAAAAAYTGSYKVWQLTGGLSGSNLALLNDQPLQAAVDPATGDINLPQVILLQYICHIQENVYLNGWVCFH